MSDINKNKKENDIKMSSLEFKIAKEIVLHLKENESFIGTNLRLLWNRNRLEWNIGYLDDEIPRWRNSSLSKTILHFIYLEGIDGLRARLF